MFILSLISVFVYVESDCTVGLISVFMLGLFSVLTLS